MSNLNNQAREEQTVWKNNLVLVQLLGLSPVLAVSSTLTYGIGLGIATFIVLVLSCLTVSLLKRQINNNWRLLWFMIIVASYTTIIEILLQLFYFPLYLRLGIYAPLICCNVAILIRLETKAFHSSWQTATGDSIKTGTSYLAALLLFSAVREILISGTLLTQWSLLLPATSASVSEELINQGSQVFEFAGTQAGALILLGLIIALINSFNSKNDEQQENIVLVERARVTGRLLPDEVKD